MEADSPIELNGCRQTHPKTLFVLHYGWDPCYMVGSGLHRLLVISERGNQEDSLAVTACMRLSHKLWTQEYLFT